MNLVAFPEPGYKNSSARPSTQPIFSLHYIVSMPAGDATRLASNHTHECFSIQRYLYPSCFEWMIGCYWLTQVVSRPNLSKLVPRRPW